MSPPRLALSHLPGGRGGGTTQAVPPTITTWHCRPGLRPPVTTTRQRRRGRRTRGPSRAALMDDAFFGTTRTASRGTRMIANSYARACAVPSKPGRQPTRRPGRRPPGRAPLDLAKCPHPALRPLTSQGGGDGARRRRFRQLSRRVIAGQGSGPRQRRRGNDGEATTARQRRRERRTRTHLGPP